MAGKALQFVTVHDRRLIFQFKVFYRQRHGNAATVWGDRGRRWEEANICEQCSAFHDPVRYVNLTLSFMTMALRAGAVESSC